MRIRDAAAGKPEESGPSGARLGRQYRFHDLTGVHGFEGGVPLLQRPGAAEGRGDIDLTAGHHGDDGFPDGPVVTEAALQGDILLDQSDGYFLKFRYSGLSRTLTFSNS